MNLSAFIIPSIIVITIICGIMQKKDVFALFCSGSVDGIKTIKSMFPTLIAVFMAIEMLKNSGIIEFITKRLENITSGINIPTEILPLMLIKPISGSASMAIATDLIKTYGTTSRIGMLAGTIMSSSETTFYVIAVYLSTIGKKGSKKIIIPALIADIMSMIVALVIVK